MSESGQKAKYSLGVDVFRFSPESGLKTDIAGCPVRAKKRHRLAYSITSSARVSSVAGTVRPSDLAVLRLITSSNLVGCSTGRLAEHEAMIWTFMAALLLCDHRCRLASSRF
jgi:hypothetical protein